MCPTCPPIEVTDAAGTHQPADERVVDERSLLRLLAQVALVAAADAALVGWWGTASPGSPATDLRPTLYLLIGVSIGRRPPPQLLLAGLALLAIGAAAQALIGQGAPAITFGVGVGSLALVLGFAVARVERALWRRVIAALLLVVALLLPFGPWQEAAVGRATPSGPPVAVLSSLPLGVAATDDGRRLMTALERRGPVTLLDSVPAGGPPTDHLLLIQPRAMTGEEMVALDEWVRRGGHAVVLDDPQLDWRGAGPLGAPDGPLPTSLLDPLVERWGVRLELPDGGRMRPVTMALDGGALTLPSPGFYTRLSPACTLLLDSHAARCAVGGGQALMVADADWLNPRQWADQSGARGVLWEAIAAGELRPVARPTAALWLALALLIAGLIAFMTERVRITRRTEPEQTG